MTYNIKNKIQTYQQHSFETMSNIDLLIEAHQKLSQQQQRTVQAFADGKVNDAQKHLENIYALTKSLFTFYGDGIESKNPLVQSLWVTLTGLHQSVLTYAVNPENTTLGKKLVVAFKNVAKMLRTKQNEDKKKTAPTPEKSSPMPQTPYMDAQPQRASLNIST